MQDVESAIFDSATSIFFHMIQGRSFREIVGIRYSYITGRDKKDIKHTKFLQQAEKLPNISLKTFFSIFKKGTPVGNANYDAVVFDTYDYMDQVISFSLSDVFIAAFQIYGEQHDDDRVEQVIDLFRYGTNNQRHILLMRYGFPPEMVNDISLHIEKIDETRIIFKNSIQSAPKAIRELVEWYLPLSEDD